MPGSRAVVGRVGPWLHLRSRVDNLCGYRLHSGVCHCDHQLKQLPGWTLTQPEPGVFTWITPAGRTYTTGADPHLTD
jgi:hypothetical protein